VRVRPSQVISIIMTRADQTTSPSSSSSSVPVPGHSSYSTWQPGTCADDVLAAKLKQEEGQQKATTTTTTLIMTTEVVDETQQQQQQQVGAAASSPPSPSQQPHASERKLTKGFSLLKAVYSVLFFGGISSLSLKAAPTTSSTPDPDPGLDASPSTPSSSSSAAATTTTTSSSAEITCVPALDAVTAVKTRTDSRAPACWRPQTTKEIVFSVNYAPVVQRSIGAAQRRIATVIVETEGVKKVTDGQVLPPRSLAGAKEDDDEKHEDLSTRPEWVHDRDAPECHLCMRWFTLFRRRHHCRACGEVFCNACSSNRITIPRLNYNTVEVRV